ncbi:hypothetical protein [Nostoc sp. UHCC 0870]|uniref:hypothetical protein n=1 Tax=Nostoc sp. UHCC 0870 TaxID=2914041 RepID=UPI001EDE462C|nr:hypothetical protein [Nostoc sp. UHCC 0870]UKP01499.1 hypothetical protein L6494_30160 [Nostoc sp. UHCC 0870]
MVQRIEEILGNSITEYTPNAVKFQGLSLSSLEQVLQEGYTTLNANFNAAPTVGSFIEFGQRCKSIEATAIFDGVVFNQTESTYLVIDAITVSGVKDLDFVGEFVKFVWGCDELEISSQQLYAWWD